MARPTDAGSLAEAAYAQLEPLTFDEATLDYPLLKYMGAIGQMLQPLDILVHQGEDGEPGWSIALDINRVPDYVLPWLGQWIGTVVDTSLSYDAQRQQIRDAEGWQRGTVENMRQAIRRSGGLLGEKNVIIRERDTGPYHFAVFTRPSETIVSSLTYGTIFSQFDYVDAVLQNLPLAYWRLGDAPNTETAFDEKNYHQLFSNGVTFGAAGLIVGDPDRSASFTASPQHLDSTDNTLFEFLGLAPMSIEATIKPTTLDANNRFIVSKRVIAADGWSLTVSSTFLGVSRLLGGVSQTVGWTHGGAIAVGGTYHIVVTFDGATINVYVNGVLVATGASNLSLVHNAAPLIIGARNDFAAVNQFLGSIDDLSVYTYALSTAQAQRDNTASHSPPQAGLYASYADIYASVGQYNDLYLAGSGVSNGVMQAIIDTKPAGLQFTYTVSDAQDYWIIWADFLSYQGVYNTFFTYTDVYNYSSGSSEPGQGNQLVGALTYQNLWNEEETYQDAYNFYYQY